MAETKHQNYAGVWGNRLGFGRRPAVLAVDFMKAYTTPGSPLYAEGVVEAVRHAGTLLAKARECGIRVLHTRVRYNGTTFEDGGLWILKAPVLKCLVEGNPGAAFCEGVEPLPGETVITKNYASAFFGTSLASTLTTLGVDTAIIMGCTTSDCIRATALDAMQYGFRPIVVQECVGDRHPDPHEANLFDIASKYGDVIPLAEALQYLETVRSGTN